MKKLIFILLFVPLVSFGQSVENNNSSTFLEKYNNTVWTDGISTIRFRKLSSIKYTESTKEIKGYVFDGFLKKSAGNGKLYDDKGYFIIQDKFENLKNIYDINAKSGLNVRESPSTSGKIVDKLEYGITVKILKKTGEPFEVEGIKGEWVEIETYNPSGERQQFGLNSILHSVFAYEVPDDRTLLECTMCGYQRITKNEGDILSYENLVRNDFGDIEDFYLTYSIVNNVLDDGNTEYVPINSDSIYIGEIKEINKKKLKVYSQKQKDSITEIQEVKNKIAQENYDFEEMLYFFTWEAVFIKNPENSYDFENNGLIKFFKSKDESAALLDFNKSIELNPNSTGITYFIRGLIKKNLNIKGFCDDWQKASDLGYYNAKESFRDSCNIKSLLKNELPKEVNKFPGTDFYTLTIEGKSEIYDYDSYKIITTDLSYVTGYPELVGEQIKIYSKDDESIEFTIGDNNNEVFFGGIVQGFMIVEDGGMSSPEDNGFGVFDLQNQKYVFRRSSYSFKIVNSKIEFYDVVQHPHYSYQKGTQAYEDANKKFDKPKCSEEIEKLGKEYPGSIGYIEKFIYDITKQKLERTGIYECTYFQ